MALSFFITLHWKNIPRISQTENKFGSHLNHLNFQDHQVSLASQERPIKAFMFSPSLMQRQNCGGNCSTISNNYYSLVLGTTGIVSQFPTFTAQFLKSIAYFNCLRWMIPPMVVHPEKIDFRRFV